MLRAVRDFGRERESERPPLPPPSVLFLCEGILFSVNFWLAEKRESMSLDALMTLDHPWQRELLAAKMQYTHIRGGGEGLRHLL